MFSNDSAHSQLKKTPVSPTATNFARGSWAQPTVVPAVRILAAPEYDLLVGKDAGKISNVSLFARFMPVTGMWSIFGRNRRRPKTPTLAPTGSRTMGWDAEARCQAQAGILRSARSSQVRLPHTASSKDPEPHLPNWLLHWMMARLKQNML